MNDIQKIEQQIAQLAIQKKQAERTERQKRLEVFLHKIWETGGLMDLYREAQVYEPNVWGATFSKAQLRKAFNVEVVESSLPQPIKPTSKQNYMPNGISQLNALTQAIKALGGKANKWDIFAIFNQKWGAIPSKASYNTLLSRACNDRVLKQDSKIFGVYQAY